VDIGEIEEIVIVPIRKHPTPIKTPPPIKEPERPIPVPVP